MRVDIDQYEAENRERRKLKDAATTGPWQYKVDTEFHRYDRADVLPTGFHVDHNNGWGCDDPDCGCMEASAQYDRDGQFIAAVRTDPVEDRIDALCRELRAARWVVDEVRTNIEQIRERCYLQTGMMLLATLVDYDAACKDTDRDCQNAHDG